MTTMRVFRTLISSALPALALLIGGSQVARAQLPAVGPLVATTATAGTQASPATGTSSYANVIVITQTMKIVAHINANMPANSTLSCRLNTATGGTSQGNVNLDTTDRMLSIVNNSTYFNNVTITYIFTPLVTAGVIPNQSRTVTFTLTTYP